jgi:DNA-binding NtrC family response regulator
MTKKYHIIIADRNPRIRNYLTRELSGEDYKVFPVKTVEQLRNWIIHHYPLDLLVLDPCFLEDDGGKKLDDLLGQIPSVPVIFHCLPADNPALKHQRLRPVFVEKSGTSVITLKQNIRSLFQNESKNAINR